MIPKGSLDSVSQATADNMLSPKRGTISCSAVSLGKMGLMDELKLHALTLLPLQWDVRSAKELNGKA